MGERAENNTTVGAYSDIEFFEASLPHCSLFKN